MLRRKHDQSLSGNPAPSASAGQSAAGYNNAAPGYSAKQDEAKIHPSHHRRVGGTRPSSSSPYIISSWFLYLVCGGAVFLFLVGSMREPGSGSSGGANTGVRGTGGGRLQISSQRSAPEKPTASSLARTAADGTFGGGGGAAAGRRGPINDDKDMQHEHHDGSPPQPQRLPPEPHADAEDTPSDDAQSAAADAANAPPIAKKYTGRRTAEEATAAMLAQSSAFVDGEKKLKSELVKLKERQKQGMDRGVKVLTQWLGDDIPAWSSKENEAEWMKKVEERKAELKSEEAAFWAKVKTRTPDAAKKQLQGEDGQDGRDILVVEGDLNGDKTDEDDDEDDEDGRISTADDEDEDDSTDEDQDATDSNDARKMAGRDGAADDASAEMKDYPSPSEMVGADAVVMLEPTFGRHRPDEDAIFAFAEGYDIKIYLAFVESLKATGFAGDIVLSVSSLSKLKPGVEDYLRAQPNLVVYTVDWKCYTGSGKLASGPKEGMRMCQFSGMYGTPDVDSPDAKPTAAEDPREARPVATARYELYWAWSLTYHSHSWIMLIDSRDTVFQTDPFKDLPRESDDQAADGTLYFFEENAEATTIGQSSYNSRWLKTAYGVDNVSSFFDKPVVCSGSTMGEKVAIEAYLRAMVAQFDETHCKVKGCDQGFHNYLHYSHSLEGVKGIRSIELHEQGKGIINNLGLLRDKPLRERGVLKEGSNEILNWDGRISPVAHQFDRDDELKTIVNDYKKDWFAKWKERG